MAFFTVEEWQEFLNAAGVTDLNGDTLVVDDTKGPKTTSAMIKMARGGASVGGPHAHPDLASKTHGHTATTTIR